LADLKPFFKTHGLARPEIEVVLRDRKKETVSTLTGDSFLYGVLLASDFDLKLFQSKWERRFVNESDDWQATQAGCDGERYNSLMPILVKSRKPPALSRQSGRARNPATTTTVV
jgi:hypothetical protein